MELKGSIWEAVSFTVMVAMEGITIALTITAKTVMTSGMNPYVFVFYTNALSSIFLLPHTFTCLRDREDQPHFTFPFLCRLFFLGLTGIAIAQNLAFAGLAYSSPIIVIAMALLIPSISLFLSIILGTTKIKLGSSTSLVKICGVLVSVMGATMITLYQGPLVKESSISSSRNSISWEPLLVFYSSSSVENWVLGCLLLAAASVSISIWNVIQRGTLKHYPDVMTIASFYSIFGTIQCGIFCIIAERSLSIYTLGFNMELLIIVLTACFGSLIRSRVHLWCMRTKGSFYVPMFKPFGVCFATIFGCSFFANSIHYGSIVAAFIVGIGYYMLMWGDIKESEKLHKEQDGSIDDSQSKVPLLQEDEKEDSQV